MSTSDVYATSSRAVEILGYVLDEIALCRIDEYARQSLSDVASDESAITFDCAASIKDRTTLHFNSINSLLIHFRGTRELIYELGLDYRTRSGGRLDIFFNNNGRIDFRVLGRTPNTEFIAESLTRELRNCDPHYNWLTRRLAFSREPKSWLAFLMFPASLILLVNAFFYIYASRIGVDVDPSLLYDGNKYFEDVERGLRSDSLEEKLNILLKGQLKGFTNVSAFLRNTQLAIGAASIALIVLVLLQISLRSYSSAYPRAFFSLGLGVERLQRLEHKREVWNIVIAIGFVVNLVAGLAVAFLPQ